jgi:hypothetical protein
MGLENLRQVDQLSLPSVLGFGMGLF